MVDLVKRALLKGNKKNQTQFLPWLKDPDNFIEDCTQCQKCLSVCETNIIVLGEGGFPTIDFQKGECTFCYACATTCPEPLFWDQKKTPWDQKITITQLCLATNNVECRSCGDACEPQAIRFKLIKGQTAQPVVIQEDCTGCGACLSYCPVNAIIIK